MTVSSGSPPFERAGAAVGPRPGFVFVAFAFICFAAVTPVATAAIRGAVSLTPDPAGPAPVGTMVVWSASGVSGDLWYRFRARRADGTFRLIRDYGPASTLQWTSLDEGLYEIEVSVLDRSSREVQGATSAFRLQSRITGDQRAVNPTSHPLVYLFSGPPCDGGRARVRYQSPSGVAQYTPYKECVAGQSSNFYLAGLAPDTPYSAALFVEHGRDAIASPSIDFETGDLPSGLTVPSVLVTAPAPDAQRMLLQAPLYLPAIATDLAGNVLWFGPSDLTYVTRPGPDGTFFGLFESGLEPARDFVRRFDLVGMTIQETNVARVNEQLAALRKRQISGFHHEARALSGGRTLVLADVEQILTGVQGPGPVDVIGDMILVLDEDLQVVWSWDTFDHMDTSRSAVLGETCAINIGCAAHYLSEDANDWMHGNAVEKTPDGALLYSARHQDWLVKIDFQDGAGNGDVIWRLGKDGDFTYQSDDPYPWFSHQHDAGYAFDSRSTITLFDNGNTRVSAEAGSTSRGQAIELDEENRVARLVLNVDLGLFSGALGSAQRLFDGSYLFDAGFVGDPDANFGGAGFSLQVDASGTDFVSSLKLDSPVYRSFRVDDLYGTDESPARQPVRIVTPR